MWGRGQKSEEGGKLGRGQKSEEEGKLSLCGIWKARSAERIAKLVLSDQAGSAQTKYEWQIRGLAELQGV